MSTLFIPLELVLCKACGIFARNIFEFPGRRNQLTRAGGAELSCKAVMRQLSPTSSDIKLSPSLNTAGYNGEPDTTLQGKHAHRVPVILGFTLLHCSNSLHYSKRVRCPRGSSYVFLLLRVNRLVFRVSLGIS